MASNGDWCSKQGLVWLRVIVFSSPFKVVLNGRALDRDENGKGKISYFGLFGFK